MIKPILLRTVPVGARTALQKKAAINRRTPNMSPDAVNQKLVDQYTEIPGWRAGAAPDANPLSTIRLNVSFWPRTFAKAKFRDRRAMRSFDQAQSTRLRKSRCGNYHTCFFFASPIFG